MCGENVAKITLNAAKLPTFLLR